MSALQLTPHQTATFIRLKDFVGATAPRVFLLKGYAGTGKTTLVGFLLRWLAEA